jgi:hypothetical protein
MFSVFPKIFVDHNRSSPCSKTLQEGNKALLFSLAYFLRRFILKLQRKWTDVLCEKQTYIIQYI